MRVPRRGQRGQAALETGLMLPVVFLILILVVGSGTMIGQKVRLSEAARVAAAAAADAVRCPLQQVAYNFPKPTCDTPDRAACLAVERELGIPVTGTCTGNPRGDPRVTTSVGVPPNALPSESVAQVQITLEVPVALIAWGTIGATASGTACLPSQGPTCAAPTVQEPPPYQ